MSDTLHFFEGNVLSHWNVGKFDLYPLDLSPPMVMSNFKQFKGKCIFQVVVSTDRNVNLSSQEPMIELSSGVGKGWILIPPGQALYSLLKK